MIITISGFPGSGKSTVAKILEKKLGLKRYYMGGLRREAARKKGITLEELNKLGETDPSTDKIVDDLLFKLGKTEDNFIAEGRTAFYFIPNSIKFFLDIDLKEGARRTFEEKKKGSDRNETITKTVEEELELHKERIENDRRRYKKYYGFDCYDTSKYDFVIDTTNLSPEEVAEKMMKLIKNFKL
mgnify:FL=1